MDDNIELKRVRYTKSPLIEVIFQVRFPTILSINSKQPVEFQENIRSRFPFFQEQTEKNGNLLFNPEMEQASVRKIEENKNYSFISENGKTKVNLTPSFLSVSTMEYTQWEDFKEIIDFVVPFFEAYAHPSFYTRIGLRYIDVITRSRLNLQEESWTRLIRPHILGMIIGENEDGVRAYSSETEYSTKVKDVLSKAHFELVHVNEQEELSLLIDCDYFQMGITKLDTMSGISEKLHMASSHFIQTAITKKLYDAMGPVEIK